jgi:hypothetical protein
MKRVGCCRYVRTAVYTAPGQASPFMREIQRSERVQHVDRVIVFQSIYSKRTVLQMLNERRDFKNAFAVYLVISSASHSINSISTEEQSC